MERHGNRAICQMSENAPASSGIACIFMMLLPGFRSAEWRSGLAVIGVTSLIAIAKSGSDFSQIARADRLTAHYIEQDCG